VSELCPPPPGALPSPRSEEIAEISAQVTRIYKRGGSHPTPWPEFRHAGPLQSERFDPHPHPFGTRRSEGVMYLATQSRGRRRQMIPGLETALAEMFQSDRLIDRVRNHPGCVIWTPARPLKLLDLDSRWTTRAGGNGALTSGPRDISRQWAAAIYSQLPDLDGMTWRSSILGVGQSIVLFGRALDAIPNLPDLNRSLSDPALLGPISTAADHIGYLVVP
jgi:RES domain